MLICSVTGQSIVSDCNNTWDSEVLEEMGGVYTIIYHKSSHVACLIL